MPKPRYSPARKQLLLMMGLVFGVHAVAIALHQLLDIEHRPRNVRTTFLVVWMAITLLIVGVGLRRIRAARTGPPRGGSGSR
jgi:hypothetical protein